jgi:hypothetical protein
MCLFAPVANSNVLPRALSLLRASPSNLQNAAAKETDLAQRYTAW